VRKFCHVAVGGVVAGGIFLGETLCVKERTGRRESLTLFAVLGLMKPEALGEGLGRHFLGDFGGKRKKKECSANGLLLSAGSVGSRFCGFESFSGDRFNRVGRSFVA